jgi:AraC-like DNA-binding protein
MIWRGSNRRLRRWARYRSDPLLGGGGGGGGGGFATDSEVIADELRDRIEEGEWAKGEALPSNSKLAEEYGVSRTTIARVMRGLAEDDLVEIIPRRGTFKK